MEAHNLCGKCSKSITNLIARYNYADPVSVTFDLFTVQDSHVVGPSAAILI